MKKVIEMAKRIGSFRSINHVVRFLTNNNETVIAVDEMTIFTLNGSVELVEKNNRIWVK